LEAANYADELLGDLQRERYIEEFLPDVSANAGRWLRIIDRSLKVSPALTRRVMGVQSRRMKRIHFGQVVPLEDVEAIMGIVGQVVRLPCVCREVLQRKEEAVCYLLAASPDNLGYRDILGRREEGRPFVEGMERVHPRTALAEMAALEERGMIHTVWTFITPFIGAICNCDPSDCLAINFTDRGLQMYFPGEEVAAVDEATCDGCGDCLDRCHFSAISLDEKKMARIDRDRCHGCGICRRACSLGSLSLMPRVREHIHSG
jgi:ferredoxin